MRFGLLITFVFLFVAVRSIFPAASQQAPQNHPADWAEMFQSQVGRCWKKLGSSADTQTANVAFRIRLKRDGTLEGAPDPEETANAARAIVECQPYHLPAEYYDEWNYFVPVFVPQKFAGS